MNELDKAYTQGFADKFAAYELDPTDEEIAQLIADYPEDESAINLGSQSLRTGKRLHIVGGKVVEKPEASKLRRTLQALAGAGLGGTLGYGIAGGKDNLASSLGALGGAALGGFAGSRIGVGKTHDQQMEEDEVMDHLKYMRE